MLNTVLKLNVKITKEEQIRRGGAPYRSTLEAEVPAPDEVAIHLVELSGEVKGIEIDIETDADVINDIAARDEAVLCVFRDLGKRHFVSAYDTLATTRGKSGCDRAVPYADLLPVLLSTDSARREAEEIFEAIAARIKEREEQEAEAQRKREESTRISHARYEREREERMADEAAFASAVFAEVREMFPEYSAAISDGILSQAGAVAMLRQSLGDSIIGSGAFGEYQFLTHDSEIFSAEEDTRECAVPYKHAPAVAALRGRLVATAESVGATLSEFEPRRVTWASGYEEHKARTIGITFGYPPKGYAGNGRVDVALQVVLFKA